MTKYKATLGTLSYLFDDESQCDAFIADNPDYVKDTFEVEAHTHYALVLQRAKVFGASLLDIFLLDKWQSAVAFTPEMSMGLLTKFTPIKQLCELGDIKTIAILLPTIELDAFYTQARKDKYVALVEAFVVAHC